VPIPGSPFAAGSDPVEVAVDPTAKFAYVANQVSHNVSVYSIGGNGALTPIPGSPFSAGIESVSVAAGPTGKFVYVVSKFSHNVSAYQIDEEGTLTPIAVRHSSRGSDPILWRSVLIRKTCRGELPCPL
jgi:6-phosphogluconolactonase